MLETIRQFALEQLETSRETVATRQRHAIWLADLAATSRLALDTEAEGGWYERLETEHDNFRAALNWTCEQGEGLLCLRLAAALRSFWFGRGYLSEGRGWLDRAVAMEEDVPFDLWAEAMSGAGTFAYHQGDWHSAQQRADRVLSAARTNAHAESILQALFLLGLIAYDRGQLREADEHLSEALSLARGAGDSKVLALVLSVLGLVKRALGSLDQATRCLTEADQLWRARGSDWGVGVTSVGLAMVALDEGEIKLAADRCLASLRVRSSARDHWGLCQSLIVTAAIMQLQGEMASLVRLLGAESAAREVIGGSLSFGLRQLLERTLPAAKQRLGEARFKALWEAGRALALPAAVDEALAFLEASERALDAATDVVSSENVHGLTPREIQVLRLLALGQSDRDIAEALFISRHTAMKHVANILAKLGVGSRTAAATVALREGLA
jgi:non-specific serine/threonine protein kinase